jgi:hypothetical protein
MRTTPKALVLAAVLLVGLVGAPMTVAAQSDDGDAETLVEAYNGSINEVPSVIANRFAGERVEIIVEQSNGETQTYTAVTNENAKITEFEDGVVDPTMRLRTDAETIRGIANAEDSGAAAVEAYESDSMTVEGVGVTNTVTLETAKVGYAVGSTLGLL